MRWVIGSLMKMLTGGVLDRVLSTVDKKIDAETDRSALKAEIIKTHYQTRVGFMRAGGFVLMLLFAVPLAAWFSSVVLYSMFWCNACAYPQPWSIAALPPPLDAWAGGIVLAIFGVIGVQTAKK